MCTHTQYHHTHTHTHTHTPLEAEHGCVSLEQESCSLSQRLPLFRPSDSSYILSVCVCVCAHVCKCVFESMHICICVSSLIALSPASVKWDSLPLSVLRAGLREQSGWNELMDHAGFQLDEPVSSNRNWAGFSRETSHVNHKNHYILHPLYAFFNDNLSSYSLMWFTCILCSKGKLRLTSFWLLSMAFLSSFQSL